MADQIPHPDVSSARPIELSFPMPKAPETSIHVHLTINTTSLLLFLAPSTSGEASSTASMGSFVYAIPDVCELLTIPTLNSLLFGTVLTYLQRTNTGQTISTPLFVQESTLEFTTRMAKLLARKSGKPTYVGNSLSFVSAGMGGTVEEEMEGFKKVVEVVMTEISRSNGGNGVNGINGS